MVSVEKRKANKLKQIGARNLRDVMIVGNTSPAVDVAKPVLTAEDDFDQSTEDISDGNSPNGLAEVSSTSSLVRVSEAATAPPSPQETNPPLSLSTETVLGGNGRTVTIITWTFTETQGSQLPTATGTVEIDKTSIPNDPTSFPDKSDTSDDGGSSGLSMGAKIGIGVAVPLVFIILGVAVFFFFRRKKQQRRQTEKGEVGEVMIIGGKHHEEDGSTAGSPSYGHPGSAPGVQDSNGNIYAQAPIEDHTSREIAGPVLRRQQEEDLMNRPVSPVQDDEVLPTHGDARSTHSGTRSGTALGGSVQDRGSPSLDDDREMQWILEEERKAKERREQQGRLPTSHP